MTGNSIHVHNILDKLDGVKATGQDQWTAKCPAHDDHHPSLSIALGDVGQILFYCHAGCNIKDICQALGIIEKDLYPHCFQI